VADRVDGPFAIDGITEVAREAGMETAVLLTLNTRNPTLQGRLQALDRLLDLASEAGVEKTLVDTTVLDIPDPGVVGKAIYHVKGEVRASGRGRCPQRGREVEGDA